MPKMVLIHIVVQQKLTQHCKANSVQLLDASYGARTEEAG